MLMTIHSRNPLTSKKIETLSPRGNLSPLDFHNRTGHFLLPEAYTMNAEMEKLTNYTEEHQMQINIKKSTVMLFNLHRKYDFMPEVIINSQVLDVVESTKLLGITLTSNLKWTENPKNLTTQAYATLLPLRRLKALRTPRHLL